MEVDNACGARMVIRVACGNFRLTNCKHFMGANHQAKLHMETGRTTIYMIEFHENLVRSGC